MGVAPPAPACDENTNTIDTTYVAAPIYHKCGVSASQTIDMGLTTAAGTCSAFATTISGSHAFLYTDDSDPYTVTIDDSLMDCTTDLGSYSETYDAVFTDPLDYGTLSTSFGPLIIMDPNCANLALVS